VPRLIRPRAPGCPGLSFESSTATAPPGDAEGGGCTAGLVPALVPETGVRSSQQFGSSLLGLKSAGNESTASSGSPLLPKRSTGGQSAMTV
jgi:hypothetical protein